MKRYAVKEIFLTVQGEGVHTGRAAVFVRFAGCNLWSGHEEHRERDAERTGAICPRFCDTDFVGGDRMTAYELADEVARLAEGLNPMLVVFTGGEPMLQLDASLLHTILDRHPVSFAIETNGTQEVPREIASLCSVTLSPKLPAERLKLRACDEIKVVYPAYDPLAYSSIDAPRRWVQPEDSGGLTTETSTANQRKALRFVLANPKWRLGTQTHKVVGAR